MGCGAQMLGTFFDGVTRHTEEACAGGMFRRDRVPRDDSPPDGPLKDTGAARG